MNFKKTWRKAFPILKNKYFITTLLFIIIVVFFSQNNLIDRFEIMKELRQLEKDKMYYLDAIDLAQEKMNDLLTNKDDLEKFAREEYLMKKPDEDIFIIVEKE